MRELVRVELSGEDLLEVSRGPPPPIEEGERLVEVDSLLVSPIDVALSRLSSSTRPGILFSGRTLEAEGSSSEKVIRRPSSCRAISRELARRCYGGELSCSPTDELVVSSRKLRWPALQFIYESLIAARDAIEGRSLLVSGLGLQGKLMSLLLEGRISVYPPQRRAPSSLPVNFVSSEEVKERSWDVVIAWTLDQGLISEALSLVQDPATIVVAPIVNCFASLPLDNLRRARVRVAWPDRPFDEEDSRLLEELEERALALGDVEFVHFSELPARMRRPYVIVKFD